VFEPETLALAQSVLDACRARGWHIATAESCTGGLVAGALTAIAGSSDVVERGVVTYSNEAKSELLGVSTETIATHGAVSAETAAAMAEGALARAPVDLAVSVIGIAGPGGATPTKPVGLVLFGLARRDGGWPHRAPRLRRRPRGSAASRIRSGSAAARGRSARLTLTGQGSPKRRAISPSGRRGGATATMPSLVGEIKFAGCIALGLSIDG
jgi:nicotinamide-nucleotide amidase